VHGEWKNKTIFARNATAKNKHHEKTRRFIEFEMKRKIKWQADWHPIQSVVDLLHRIDGIVSVVTGYSLIIFFFLPLFSVLFILAHFWFRRALSTSAVT